MSVIFVPKRVISRTESKNITSIQPLLLEMIYQELVLDSSTASHPDTVERICIMFLGAEGLVVDLWHYNAGRLGNKYNMLFTHMEAVVKESLAVANDCCHGASHMSQWVSIKDLFIRKSARCSENTPISSDWEIRFKFHFSQYSLSHLAWKSQNNVKKDKEFFH